MAKWSYIDIALAKVESAYDLNDDTFKKLCTYTPTVISVCYEEGCQEPGTDAIVLGWGHKEIWRLVIYIYIISLFWLYTSFQNHK